MISAIGNMLSKSMGSVAEGGKSQQDKLFKVIEDQNAAIKEVQKSAADVSAASGAEAKAKETAAAE